MKAFADSRRFSAIRLTGESYVRGDSPIFLVPKLAQEKLKSSLLFSDYGVDDENSDC